MKPIPDCVPDALTMILAAARAVSDEDFIHRKVLLKVMNELADMGDFGTNAADIYLQCWEIACRALGVKDPYENDKARSDKTALGILKIIADKFPADPKDRLAAAIRTSLVGAMVDFNVLGRSDMEEKITEYFRTLPAIDDTPALVAAIERAESVMLVAARAGEIAMDKPLVETMADMGKKVYLTVSAKPVFHMATEKDAETAQFSERIEVIKPGTAMYGLAQDRASSEFIDVFERTDLVIAKGSIHYSTLLRQRDVFFILRASLEDVAADLCIKQNSGAIVRVKAAE